VKRPKLLSHAFVHSAALGNVKTHGQGELKWEEEKEAWRGRNVSQRLKPDLKGNDFSAHG
jgi:hypothetical protein